MGKKNFVLLEDKKKEKIMMYTQIIFVSEYCLKNVNKE